VFTEGATAGLAILRLDTENLSIGQRDLAWLAIPGHPGVLLTADRDQMLCQSGIAQAWGPWTQMPAGWSLSGWIGFSMQQNAAKQSNRAVSRKAQKCADADSLRREFAGIPKGANSISRSPLETSWPAPSSTAMD